MTLACTRGHQTEKQCYEDARHKMKVVSKIVYDLWWERTEGIYDWYAVEVDRGNFWLRESNHRSGPQNSCMSH